MDDFAGGESGRLSLGLAWQPFGRWNGQPGTADFLGDSFIAGRIRRRSIRLADFQSANQQNQYDVLGF